MARVATSVRRRVSAEDLLGGRAALHVGPRSPLDWVAMIRRGLPAATVDSVVAAVGVTQSELAHTLGISERTLVRRKREGTLNAEESGKIVRLARVVARAEEVFEDLEPALDWLKSPNAALGGVTPLSLLDTDVGGESVSDTLGRIEHGVFS